MRGWGVHNYPLRLLKRDTKLNLSDRESQLPDHLCPTDRPDYGAWINEADMG